MFGRCRLPELENVDEQRTPERRKQIRVGPFVLFDGNQESTYFLTSYLVAVSTRRMMKLKS